MTNKLISRIFAVLLFMGAAIAHGEESPALLANPDLDLWGGGEIFAIAHQPNGGTIVAGRFTHVDGMTPGGIVRLRADGSVDSDWSATAISVADAYSYRLAVDANGDVYVSANYLIVNRQTRMILAKLSGTSGELVTGWNPPPMDGFVYSVASDGADSIYIAGSLYGMVGGHKAAVKFSSATGALDPDWDVPSDGFVNDMIIGTDGAIYVGGSFTTIGGVPRSNIARLSGSDGVPDASWNASANDFVEALALDSCGGLYAGGDFTAIDGVARTRIARLFAADGTLDSGWNASADDSVYALTTGSDCSVFLGGTFHTVNGQSRQHVAKLSPGSGSLDAPWNPDASLYVMALDAANGVVAIGGYFDQIAHGLHMGLARLDDQDGAVEAAPDAEILPTVDVLAATPDGGMIVGGSFTKANNLSRRGLLRLKADGTLDLNWHSPFGPWGGSVDALAVGADGSIYLAGGVGFEEGDQFSGIAKLSGIDGSPDPVWHKPEGLYINALAVGGDGNVYAGGAFTDIGGLPQRSLARLSSISGAVDRSWRPSLGGGFGDITSLIADSSGRILVSGNFSTFDGQDLHGLVRLSASSGSLDTTWNPPLGGPYPIATSPDGDVYIGYGSEGRITKLSESTGAAVPDWEVLTGSRMSSLAVAGNGDVYAAGDFSSIGNQAHEYLAKISGSTGTVDPDWDPSPDWFATVLATTSRDTIYVGGSFKQIGEQPQQRLGLAAFSDQPDGQGIAIDARFSGNWFDPQQSGHGFLLEALPNDSYYATWYVFADGQPLFLQGVGTPQGNTLSLDMFSAHSTAFPVGAQASVEPWGQVSFTFSSEDQGRASWAPTASGFTSGTMPLSRLSTPASVDDDRAGLGKACRSGIWYDPNHSGYGFNLEVDDNNDGARVIQTFWYTYRPDGSPLWLFGVAPLTEEGADVDLYLAGGAGAQFPDAFDSATLERTHWGQVHLRFAGDSLLDVDYSSVLPEYGSGSLIDLHRLTVLAGHDCSNPG